MKAIRIICWTIIGFTSLVGTIELSNKVDEWGSRGCSRMITITDFSIWLSQHPATIVDYREGTWHDVRENKVIGTAPTEDSDICVK